jgi:PEGA domain
MRIALTLALLAALASPARAGNDVGVIVTGESSMQPQLAAQIENWLSQHGHTLVPSPLPPEAISLLADCFVMDDKGCARTIIEQRAKSTTMVYARLETKNGTSSSARDVTLTVYWFNKGHDAVTQGKTCEHCTDQSLRTTSDEIMKKLLGGGDLGHVKLKSVPPGARITIDGQAIGVTPLDWDLPPGKHTIQMDKAGLQPQTKEIVIVSNKTELFGMKLTPPSEDDHDDQQPSRILPFSLLGAGGALVAAGIVMIAIDQDPSHKLGMTYRDTAPAGVGLIAGGVVAGGIGAYLLWFHSPKSTSTPVAAFTSDTAYIGWLGRF